jgi:hypothetical protein
MKKMIWLTLLITIGVVAIVKSNGGTEQQPYTVLKTMDKFEIRHYPEAIVASLNTGSSAYRSEANGGFRVLASYIFGGNDKNMQIAMTAPVRMGMEDGKSYMQFVMPAAYDMEDLPAPNSNNVELRRTKAETAAAIRFGGWASEQDIQQHIKELDTLLSQAGILHDGNFRYLGYNSPYRVVNRRNEILVGIQAESDLLGDKPNE